MSDLRFILSFAAYIICWLAAIIGLALFLTIQGAAWGCRGYQHVTGLPTKMQATTCYVQEGGRWMSWDERVVRNATAGAK